MRLPGSRLRISAPTTPNIENATMNGHLFGERLVVHDDHDASPKIAHHEEARRARATATVRDAAALRSDPSCAHGTTTR